MGMIVQFPGFMRDEAATFEAICGRCRASSRIVLLVISPNSTLFCPACGEPIYEAEIGVMTAADLFWANAQPRAL